MDTSTQDKEPARPHYAGIGHGWIVTRRYVLDGYPQTFRVDGPYTTREQAQAAADRINADTSAGKE